MQYLLSSEKMTFLHCRLRQFCRCKAHWRRARRCLCVRTGPLYGRRHLRLYAANRRRTVSSLMGRWCVPMVLRAVSDALVNRSFKCWRNMNLFCLGVVTCGLPLRGRSSVLLVALKRWRRRSIVRILQLKSFAITLAAWPACNLPMAWSLCCRFKRGIALLSKLVLIIMEMFTVFIPLMKHEKHEHQHFSI